MNRRAKYAKALAKRVCEVVAPLNWRPGLLDPDFWESLRPADIVLAEALDAYEAGQVDREELDSKAAGYLQHFREVCAKYKP